MAIAPIFSNSWGNTPVSLGSIIPGQGGIIWNPVSFNRQAPQPQPQQQPQLQGWYQAINPNFVEQWTNPLLWAWRSLPARQSLSNNLQQANQRGFPQLWHKFQDLISALSSRDNQSQWLLDLYGDFGNNLYDSIGDRNSFYGALNQDVLGELSNLVTQYEWTYWPQWSQTQRVNDLYGNYGNYLVNKNAQDRALASWAANRYGLSENARRISESDAWLQGLSEALKIFDAETQALDNINKTFNTLTTDAFGKYKWVQDDYLKSLYDQNFWIQTQLSQGLLNLLANNEQLKTQTSFNNQVATGAPSGEAATPATQVQYYWVSQGDDWTVSAIWADEKTYLFTNEQFQWLLQSWEATLGQPQ